MCLWTVDKKIDRRYLRREGKHVVCWKVAAKDKIRRLWKSYIFTVWYKPGWNISERRLAIPGSHNNRYIPHYHAFMTKRAAQRWLRGSFDQSSYSIIKCKTFLKYITATGNQEGKVLVTKKIWIPPYPDTE